MYITLRCFDCENIECKICPCGKYISENSKQGCTRQLTDEEADKYYHLLEEVRPFIYKDTTKEYQNKTYKKIIDFLYDIYSKPLGQKIGKSGKAVIR